MAPRTLEEQHKRFLNNIASRESRRRKREHYLMLEQRNAVLHTKVAELEKKIASVDSTHLGKANKTLKIINASLKETITYLEDANNIMRADLIQSDTIRAELQHENEQLKNTLYRFTESWEQSSIHVSCLI